VNNASNQGTGLTGRAALLAVANSMAFAMAFMLPLVLVRTLPQSEFGLYKQAFQIVTTALALLGLHVSTTAFYFMPRHPEKKAQIVLNVLIFYFAVGAVLALVFAIHPQWVTLIFKSDDLAPHIPLLGLAILLWLVSSFLEIVTVADGHIRAATIFIVAVQLSKSLLLIGAGLAFGTIRALLIAAVIQGALQCAILLIYLYRRFGVFWKSFDAKLLKAQLANALPFGFGGLVVSLQLDLNKYFVSHYFDPADFAIYSVGCFQIPLMMVLVDSVSSVLIPEVARLEMEGNNKKIIALWMAVMRKLSLFFVPTAVALLVLRHEFITALFTKDYAGAAPIFAINLIAFLLTITVTGPVLRAFEDLKFFRLKLYICLIPVTCGALYVGIKTAGLTGAIAADVSIQLLAIATTIIVIGRRLRMGLVDLKQLTPILRTAAAAAVAGLAALAVKMTLADARPFVTLAVASAVFGAVYLVMAVITGAVTDEEKAEMRRLTTKVGSFRQGRMPLPEATEIR
jgi:O-antigen/teichoic acid export membrane protein